MSSKNVPDSQKRQTGPLRRWSSTGFACAFVLFGALTFFNLHLPFAERFWPHVTETLTVATTLAVLVGRFGDVAFMRILTLLSWVR